MHEYNAVCGNHSKQRMRAPEISVLVAASLCKLQRENLCADDKNCAFTVSYTHLFASV